MNNRFFLITHSVLIIVTLLLSCSPKPAAPVEKVMSAVLTSPRPLEYYSSATLSMLNRLNKNNSIGNISAVLPFAAGGIQLDIIRKEPGFFSQTLFVRIKKHSSENMVGIIMPVTFIVEKGSWKIDGREMLKGVQRGSGKDEKDYLLRIENELNYR